MNRVQKRKLKKVINKRRKFFTQPYKNERSRKRSCEYYFGTTDYKKIYKEKGISI